MCFLKKIKNCLNYIALLVVSAENILSHWSPLEINIISLEIE